MISNSIEFGDKDFIRWWNNLSIKEKKKVWKAIHEAMGLAVKEHTDTLTDIQNVPYSDKVFRYNSPAPAILYSMQYQIDQKKEE